MNKRSYIIIFTFLITLLPISIYAGRGCCSWHGGQDYCDNTVGKWVCKDGTYSPTCTCSTNSSAIEHDNSIIEQDNSVIEYSKSPSYNSVNEEETRYSEDNFIPTIIIMFLSYYISNKIINFDKNKINFKIIKLCNIIVGMILMTFSFIIVPFILGMTSHFILEAISIFILSIVYYISDG